MSGSLLKNKIMIKFDPGLIIWTTIIFTLLLLVLKKFAWKPILKSVEERSKSIQEALDLPRAFALNGELKVEKSLNVEIKKELKKIGHNVITVDNAIGGGQCIKIDRKEGSLIGGSDPRKDGMAIGY